MAGTSHSTAAPLREGVDFSSPEEFADRVTSRPVRREGLGTAGQLARCIDQEIAWLRRTGALPNGVAWDRQPAWRAELWVAALDADGQMVSEAGVL